MIGCGVISVLHKTRPNMQYLLLLSLVQDSVSLGYICSHSITKTSIGLTMRNNLTKELICDTYDS